MSGNYTILFKDMSIEMQEQQKVIIRLVSLWYNHSRKRAWEWYNTPHILLENRPSYGILNTKPRTPRQMVQDGEGARVIEFIEIAIK